MSSRGGRKKKENAEEYDSLSERRPAAVVDGRGRNAVIG